MQQHTFHKMQYMTCIQLLHFSVPVWLPQGILEPRKTSRTSWSPHFFFFFFFPWHYSPLWALACRTMSFHFFPICHQFSPSSHSQHLKISFCFLFPSFTGSSSPSSLPFQFLSEDRFGLLSSSILSRWPSQLILCHFIHFTIFSPLLISSSSRFLRLFHFPFFIFRTI